MISLFASWCIFTSTISIILGFYVWYKGRDKHLNRIFFLALLSIALWILGLGLMTIAPSRKVALFWLKYVHYLGAIFILPTTLHYIFIFLGRYNENKRIIIGLYILAVVLQICNFTGLLADVIPKAPFRYYTEAGPLYSFFAVLFFAVISYISYLLFVAYRNSIGLERNRIKYLFLGTGIGFISGATAFFPVYHIPIFPFGIYFIPAYAIMLSYAIVKYHLMDINIIFTRAGIFAIVYTFILGSPFWLGYKLLGARGLWYLPIGLAIILATTGPFIYNYLRRRAEDILLKEQKRYQRALRDFSSTLIFIKDIEELAQKVVSKIVESVKLNFCAMYLRQDNNFYLKSKKSEENVYLPSKIDIASEFVSSIKKANAPLLGDYLPQLKDTKAGLVAPLFLNQEISGFIILGQREKGTIFTDSDLDIFSIVSNQTSLALSEIYYFKEYQKATEEKYRLLIEKARLESAFQISEAYRHELGNIINIISVSLADLMFLDEYMPTKEDIERAVASIRGNVKRAQNIFNAIGDYNKNSGSEFKDIELDKMLKDMIEKQKEAISRNNIHLEIDVDKNIRVSANNNLSYALKYILGGAIGAIAYYNSQERLISIKLKNRDNSALLEISDTGKNETTSPFYKGVGIERGKEGGILYFIARRIVFDHQGKFEMTSFNNGKGTSFIVSLPLKQ